MSLASPHFLILGQLRREYLITPENKVYIDQPGGNLLYALGGLVSWLKDDEVAGMIARAGEDYPRNWLDDLAKNNVNIEGVKILPETIDLRDFMAYTDQLTSYTDDPISHFARLEISFPRSLLGYKDSKQEVIPLNKSTVLSLRQSDIPDSYRLAKAAHVCHLDFLTHSLMPADLRQGGVQTITLDPSPVYMKSENWDQVPSLFTGLTALLPSENEVRELFKGRSEDLWEMAEALGAWGCNIIVIKRREHGQFLYDVAASKRYEISAYPSKVVDPTGIGDSFCGGFLAGYQKTFDPLQAVLHGSVSASLALEGSGAFYNQSALPGLHQARLENLMEAVREI